MTEEDKIDVAKEIEIMKEVDHPNIVRMIANYEDNDYFFLVMELMKGGEVRKFLF